MPLDQRPRHRQARGERRIAHLLDVAAEVFAEVGYEAATTNGIAACAGMSPGSLYQFFSNKEAIAKALAARYVEQLQLTHDAALAPGLARLPLDQLLDRMVDPLVRFHISNPGFQALFAGPDGPQLAAVKQPLRAAVLARVEAILTARAPGLPQAARARCARVGVELVRALLPLVVAAADDEREAYVGELKKVLRGYLAPLIGEASA